VGKIAEKAICRSVFLTIWHCILSALQTVFSAILLIGLQEVKTALFGR